MKATLALQIDFMSSLKDIWSEILSGLPKVFGFIGFVLLAWIFIKVLLLSLIHI